MLERSERHFGLTASRSFEDQYTEPSNVVRICSGPCEQKACSVPDACRLPEEDEWDAVPTSEAVAYIFGLIVLAVAVAGALFWVFK